MSDTTLALVFLIALFVLLGSGVWVGLSLMGVAWIAMEFFTTRPAGDAMATTVWGSLSSWTLTALPLFIWMGEILFRSRLSEDLFSGLAPWMAKLPGRLMQALQSNAVQVLRRANVTGLDRPIRRIAVLAQDPVQIRRKARSVQVRATRQ